MVHPSAGLLDRPPRRNLTPALRCQLAVLGSALPLRPRARVLDLACGAGELLCAWARDHDVAGVGVDMNAVFVAEARARAAELGVSDRVAFVHGDAATHVSDEPVDVAVCLGASWSGGGTADTVALLERSVAPGGMLLIGEVFRRYALPDGAEDAHVPLPDLVADLRRLGWQIDAVVIVDDAEPYLGWGLFTLVRARPDR